MMNKRPFRKNPPVNVGDELDVTIESVGEKGDGVAKKEGFVLFVPGAKQGQNVKIKVNRVLKSVGFAEIIGEGSGQPAAPKKSEEESSGEERYSGEQSSETYEEDNNDSEDFGEDENQ